MNEINYLKYAFKEKFNYILLFFVVFSFLFIKRFFFPLAFIEISYLFFISQSTFYRNYIKNKYYSGQDKKERIYKLDGIFREKAEKLYDKLNQVNFSIKNRNLKDILSKEAKELDYLFENYINFATNATNYSKYLNDNTISKIDEEIRNLKYRIDNYLAGTKPNDLDDINTAMQKKNLLLENLKILEKRKSKIREIKNTVDKLKAQLGLIENTFYLISDNLITFGSTESLDIDVSTIINGIENTGKIVKSTEQEMNELRKIMNNKRLLN